ncbi:MAG TPA: hypothetical protein VHW74_01505 [Mycobacteriales bacterium]|jgi:hypothetical protein|nr:hypothetical protein [Mycobacteriales bacterium]
MATVVWKDEPEEHDYPAAEAYLTLITDPKHANALSAALQKELVTHQKAKDILRAAGLALLPTDNAHVAADLQKIKDGKHLSPILLIRGNMTTGTPLEIADGYHRVCASYHVDENTDIPCRIAEA